MQLLAYILIYPFLYLISILPFRVLYFFSDVLYIFIYTIIGYRKRVVKENLILVFPEKSEKEIKTIMKGFYHHLCDMILESIKSMTISDKEIIKRFKYTNLEEIKKYEEKGESGMLLCSHYASWEWILSLQKYIDYKGYVVYKKLRNKYFDRLIKRIRGRFNGYLITTKETISTLNKSKKEGDLFLCGMAADQSPKLHKTYHWLNFMNIMSPVHTGAEMIAKKLDLPVIFLDVEKVKRGYYKGTFTTLTKSPRTIPDYKITEQYFELIEKQIKRDPQYYLWTHKRWKHKDKVPKEFKL